ncbi:hypothetical protein IVB12_06820 [Bradyrhizobium sp. 179]|uniref:hypothetical protein n=1 Tax=Bradyrhizobium sp. 179 TaxID=2782648 RepID=UPI001FF8D460|nr:hypothetical protein [Bradyrhizobium sp. 179]MCK1541699.1 hypothetical protein [Bradyrhizobium sp. 179]
MAAAIRDVSIDEDMPDDTNAIQAECSLNLQAQAHRDRFAAANKRQIKKARRARALGENGMDLFLVLVAGTGAWTADRQPIGRMTDTHVPLGLCC